MHKTLFLLLISSFTFSQTHTITGVVSDSINFPLESANIIAKPLMENAQLKFAIADNKGRYCLELENAIKYEVTAWFCPQIPFAFGPNGFGALPGLILELQTKDAVFGTKKIILSNDTIVLKTKLKNYKAITDQEIEKLIEKKHEEFMNEKE